jgi:hypothetical protein
MAGGPIHPFSAVPDDSGLVFPYIYKTTASFFIEGMGVTDSTTLSTSTPSWFMYFQVPETLPSGTPTLRTMSRTSATTGNHSYKLLWNTAAASGHSPDATVNDEGTETFAVDGTADDAVSRDTTMNVVTVPAAGEIVTLELQMIGTTYTIAAVSFYQVSIVWV